MASGKTLQSTIEISGVLSPSLQKAINTAVDRLAEMSEETLASADAASKLAAEMTEQEEILKNLRKAYAGYVANGEDSSEQAQDLAKHIKVVSKELNDNRDTLKRAETAANNLDKELEDVDDDFRKAGNAAETAGNDVKASAGGWTVLKDVIADLVSEGLEKAAEAFGTLATEGDSSLAMLEARTGASTKEMQGFKDVMYDVYNGNYGESLGDVSDTLSTVIQMTDDLDNAQLTKVTKNALTLRDVYGYDVTESMRAVNALTKQFGITSDEAFNLIVQGAQNGLDQNGDLLDTVNEYAVQFENAGFTADQMFNMLANGAASGTWSVDKLGDAVKEYNIRMSDGTATAALMENYEALGLTKAEAEALAASYGVGGTAGAEAMRTTLDAILAVEDENERYKLGVAMFGTMWEDLGEDAVNALFLTEGAIDKTNQAMAGVDSATYDTLSSKLQQLGRTINAEVVQPIAEKLTPVMKNAVDYVNGQVGPAVDWVTSHLPEIGVAATTVGAIIAAMNWANIVTQITKIKGSFAGLTAMFTKVPGPVWAIIGVVAALAAGFMYLWDTNEEFRTNVTAIWEELKGSFSTLGDTLMNCINQLMPLFTQIGTTLLTTFAEIAAAVIPVLVQVVADILPVIIELINQLLPILTVIIETVLTVLADVLAQLLPVFVQIIQMVLPVLLQLIQTLLPVFMQIIQMVLPVLVELINAILPVVTQIVMAILPVLVTILNTLTPIFELVISLLQPILDLFLALLQPVLDIITLAITPLITIFTSLMDTVLTPIIPIIQTVAEYISTVLGVAFENLSPIITGIQTVLQGLTDFIKGTFSADWGTAWSGVVSAFGAIWDTVVGLVKLPINGVIGLVNSAIGLLNKVSVTIPEWVPEIGGQTYGINLPTIPLLASGGFTDGVSIAGEAGTEAVISFDRLYRDKNIGIWEKAGQMLGVLGNQPQDNSLTAQAGKLLTLDDFSLGSLVDGTSVVIYYDFSNFTWSPHVESGAGEDDDSLMARLKAHEAEFFEWLEEFIQMREVAQYA